MTKFKGKKVKKIVRMVEIHQRTAYYGKGYIHPVHKDDKELSDDEVEEVVEDIVVEVVKNMVEQVVKDMIEEVKIYYRFDEGDEKFNMAALNRNNIYLTPSTNEFDFDDDDEGKLIFSDEFSCYICVIFNHCRR